MTVFIAALLIVTAIGFGAAALLAFAAHRYPSADASVVDLINRELPQTQCAQCGYPGCRPYAEAIAAGEAINRCPPGGDATVARLADLLGRQATPVDPALPPAADNFVAAIVEEECIGCTLCIRACPVDAIVGAQNRMHTIIEAECTGCELCVEPCPVDCIEMIERQEPAAANLPADADGSDTIPEMPCIHCDECEPVCPRNLRPQLLHWYLQVPDKLRALNVMQCIECRRCDIVCPSHIPLARRFHDAKASLQQMAEQAEQATRLETRYLRRQARERKEAERVRSRPDKKERAALIDAVKDELTP